MADNARSYNYANGSVAVLSQKLLKGDRLLRMADSSALPDALKLLSESGYGDGVNAANFEALLEAEWQNTLKFVNSVSAETDTTDCFVLPIDFRNAKILMKNKYSNTARENLTAGGKINAKILQSAVTNGDYSELPPEMADACTEIDNLFSKGERKPDIIDNLLDKAYYQAVLRLIKKTKSQAVKDYFTAEIDGKNLIMFFRLRKNGFSAEYFQSLFLDGGTIEKETLLDLYDKPFEDAAEKFKATVWKTVAQTAVSEIKNGASLAETERLLESRKRALVIPYKSEVGTIMPLVNYILAKRTEMENIRLILVCIKNKVQKDKITKRLRELYV